MTLTKGLAKGARPGKAGREASLNSLPDGLGAFSFAASEDGQAFIDSEGRVAHVNPALLRMLGQPDSECVVGLSRQAFSERFGLLDNWGLLKDSNEGAAQAVWLSGQATYSVPVYVSVMALPDHTPWAGWQMVTFRDASLLYKERSRLARVVGEDSLTGLPGRQNVVREMEDRISRGAPFAVVFLDLARFSDVNTRFGWPAGDRVLQEVGKRLQRVIRPTDISARLGGDDFLLLLDGAKHEADVEPVVERVQADLTHPIILRGEFGEASLSVEGHYGVTFSPADGGAGETLIRHAQFALYKAKRRPDQIAIYFDTAKDALTRAREKALVSVSQALDEGRLRMYYHPQVDMRTGAVVGMEALLRCEGERNRVVLPADFLPYIYGTDVGLKVGRWTLKEAILQLEEWLRAGLPMSMGVNVTAHDLLQEDFPRFLQSLLDDSVVSGHDLELEILESVAVGSWEQLQIACGRVRELGVRLSLDDFGTGHSTLEYLSRLPATSLKLDREFVASLKEPSSNGGMIQGLINMAYLCNLEVVAEGVEDCHMAGRLLELNCRLQQGFGIARPMPAEQLQDWLKDWSRNGIWRSLRSRRHALD